MLLFTSVTILKTNTNSVASVVYKSETASAAMIVTAVAVAVKGSGWRCTCNKVMEASAF